jgi:uncharacterized repeat protein (TIGR01451 family)
MTVSQNGDIIIWIVPITNNSSYKDTNVLATNTFSAGQEYVSHTVTKGNYNTTTGLWTIGDMQGLTTETLTVRTRVTDILSAPFELESGVTGDLNGGDPTPFTQTVLLDSCPATGAGIDDLSGCLCIDVSLNDTKCTKGTTTWELNIPSITNCTTYTWDEATGKGNFTPIDPTLPITGTYDMFCTSGMTVTQVSCGVEFTITKQLENKDIFDHTLAAVQYADLSVGDISVLTAQYPALTLADFCWNTLRNSDGVLTSGTPVQCDEAIDTRTFFTCTEDACIADLGECACSAVLPTDVTAGLPVDYEPQDGDTVYIQHPEATSIWVYSKDDLRWERNDCGCVYKISQAAGNLLTLNVLDNAPYISEEIILDATDEKVKVSSNDTTSGFLLGKLVAGTGISLTETNNGANETLVIAASAAPSTNVQVADTCSINLGIAGDGTTLDPFVISANYNDGNPTPNIVSISAGVTGITVDVSTLWGDACAAGCTSTYTLITYPDNVYDNVTLVGTTLTYDILADAPSGTHPFIIERDCTNV